MVIDMLSRSLPTALLLVLVATSFSLADRRADDKSILLQKPVESTIGQGFGVEYNALLRREQMNTAIGFTVAGRQAVVATADGILNIRRTGREKMHISIRHDRGFESHYSNMSESLLDDGAAVRKGEVIGYIEMDEGGGMLYYAFFFRGNAIDPIPFFENRDFS